MPGSAAYRVISRRYRPDESQSRRRSFAAGVDLEPSRELGEPMISRRRVLNGMLLTGAGLLASSVLELAGPRQALAQAAGLVYGAHPDVSPLVLTGRDWTSKYKLNIKYEWFPSAGPAD